MTDHRNLLYINSNEMHRITNQSTKTSIPLPQTQLIDAAALLVRKIEQLPTPDDPPEMVPSTKLLLCEMKSMLLDGEADTVAFAFDVDTYRSTD